MASFDPPPTYHDYTPYYPCNATAPPFGVSIGGKVFNLTNTDIIYQRGSYVTKKGVKMCPIYVQNGGIGGGRALNVLGEVFLNNVVAVFDVGENVVRFAAHDY